MDIYELKQKLIEIKNNGYLPGDADIEGMLSDMMDSIGSVDYVLRDELIYSTFNRWTVNGVLSVRLMKRMLDLCLDDKHLFYNIGENGTDSVFTRAFSVLIIPLAFYLDGKESFLYEPDVIYIKEQVIRYLKLESDVRGFVEGKGWAHSTAHAADALDDIARSKHIGREALKEILAAIKEKICIDYYTYIHGEDERMAAAALSVINRSILSNDEITAWINSFYTDTSGVFPGVLHTTMNTRNFLRSLYFLLYNDKDMQDIIDSILNTLRNI